MSNKKFLGKLLAVMLSLSIAASVGAAEFGDGTDGSIFTDTGRDTAVSKMPEPSVPPMVTAAPIPSEMPEPSAAPEPSVTSVPSGVPEPSVTPVPPELSVTPNPSEVPEPSVTPNPSETPNPSVTPELTITPEPSVPPTPDPYEDYTYTELEDKTICIIGYKGDDNAIEIPAEIDGKPVSEINQYAFANLANAKEITIPDTVSKIGGGAFHNCKNLELVKIPASVTEIEPGAFSECPVLNLDISPENPSYAAKDGALFSKDLKTFVECIGDKDNYTVPKEVTQIGPGAFYGYQTGTVTILNPDCRIVDIDNSNRPVFPDGTAIRSYLGSDAQRYAEENMLNFIPIEKADISKAAVSLSDTSCSYTGKALKPKVTVVYKKILLKSGRDYTVTYTNSTKLGTATVTLKGKGNYTGTVKKNFKVILGTPALKSAVSAGYNAVKISWNAVPGARSYNLYCKGGTSKSWKTVASGITGTSYKHTSGSKYTLTAGTSYTYTVRAVNGKNISGYDKTGKSVKPIPATVKLGKVTSTAYNKQKITWSKVDGATGYVVYQRINNSWKKIASTRELSYINTNGKDHPVATGVTNTYTVRAYRKVGKTYVYSKYPAAGISGKALLAKPVVSRITKTSKGLKLEWKKISGAAGYVVQRYDSGKWVTKKTIKSSKTLNYTDTTAKKGKTYQYRIAAYCNANGKPFYSVYSASKSGKR